MSDSGIEQGGIGYPDIRKDLLGGGEIIPAVWVRYMVPDAAHEDVLGRILPQGGPQADRA